MSPALAGWLQGSFWVFSCAAAIASLGYLATWRAMERYWSASVSSEADALERWSDLERAADALQATTILLWLATLVLLVVWTFRAHKACDRLLPFDRTWGRGWTIGAWFVPLGNMVLPVLVMCEIDKMATGPRISGHLGEVLPARWNREAPSLLTVAWWVTFVIGVLFMSLSEAALADDAFSVGRPDAMRSYTFGAAGLAFYAASGVSGALMARRISRMLTPHMLRFTPSGR